MDNHRGTLCRHTSGCILPNPAACSPLQADRTAASQPGSISVWQNRRHRGKTPGEERSAVQHPATQHSLTEALPPCDDVGRLSAAPARFPACSEVAGDSWAGKGHCFLWLWAPQLVMSTPHAQFCLHPGLALAFVIDMKSTKTTPVLFPGVRLQSSHILQGKPISNIN